MKSVKRVLAAITLLLCAFTITGCGDDEREVSDALFAMDTHMSFTLYGENAESAADALKKLIGECEKNWSVTDQSSEIARLNASGALALSDRTAQLLSLAKEYSALTSGFFDPTVYPLVQAWGFTTGKYRVPDKNETENLKQYVGADRIHLNGSEALLDGNTKIDLGGIAKGFLGDLAVEKLKKAGVKSAILRLGGNIVSLGLKPDGSKWKIAIKSPYDSSYIAILSVSDTCVITSGAYERYFMGADGSVYGHIISPFTGRPAASGLSSVTVICPTGSLGDALSTALFVMGTDEAIQFWKSHSGFEMVLLGENGTLYVTEGIYPSFTKQESSSVKEICEIKR